MTRTNNKVRRRDQPRRRRRRGRAQATPEQIEAIWRQKLAGTWTPPPPTEDDDPVYHGLYARWQQENR